MTRSIGITERFFSMKTIAKLGLVGLALAASSAHADVFLPNTGNGELTLFVRNDVTGEVYARGLQIRIDSVLSQAQIDAGYTGDTSTRPRAADQLLARAASDRMPTWRRSSAPPARSPGPSWRATTPALNTASPDARRYLTTTTTTWDDIQPERSSRTATLPRPGTSLQQTLVTLNGVLGGAEGSGDSTAVNGQWRQARCHARRNHG